jgi:hypothetical protein
MGSCRKIFSQHPSSSARHPAKAGIQLLRNQTEIAQVFNGLAYRFFTGLTYKTRL